MTREEAAKAVAFRKRILAMDDPEITALMEERDALWMNDECGKEIIAEWAAQARALAPKDGPCDCDSCAITHALNVLSRQAATA